MVKEQYFITVVVEAHLVIVLLRQLMQALYGICLITKVTLGLLSH